MVAIQNTKAKVPRKFIRQYHLKKLFYERFPDKEERKDEVKRYADLLGIVPSTVRILWSIRPEDNSDMSGEQVRLSAEFFGIPIIEFYNLENEVY